MSPWTTDQHARGSATHFFNFWWRNEDYLYRRVLDYARERQRRFPNITTLTLGRNVRDTLIGWYREGFALAPSLASLVGQDVVTFGLVDEIEVGEAVLEALAIEDC